MAMAAMPSTSERWAGSHPALLPPSQPLTAHPPLSACFLPPMSYLPLHLPPSSVLLPCLLSSCPYFLSAYPTFSPRSLRSPFSPRGPGKP